jgi:RNA polymerase sigma-70 factor, ECF subfamily
MTLGYDVLMLDSPNSRPIGQDSPGSASDEREMERRWLQAAHKDPENFQFFYDKYLSRIRGYIYRRTLDLELTNDLSALTFTNALSTLDNFVWQDRLLGSWLFRIATNEIYKHAEGQSRLATVGNSDKVQNNTPDPHRSQLSRIILSEDQVQLYGCLEKLCNQDQDILTLYYWEGLKTREVADALNICENTVKTRLARSRKKLKQLMGEDRYKPTS